jgi:arylsulfatase A-like enzyme
MSLRHRSNVVFIFADQMRGMDMGCAGNDEVATPNMDRLAGQGTMFGRAYANCPVCTPSRAMLLTGRYPLSNRVIANDLPLPDNMPTVGETFKESGYRTGYIGKWHLDGVPRSKWTPPGPQRHGFDYWAAYNCSHDYFRPEKYFTDSPEPVEVEGYEPVVQTDLALEFISQNSAEPFCLFLSWGPPHDPYPMVPEEYKEMYDPERLTPRPNSRAISPGSNELAQGLEPRRTLADYYAAITALDEQLGRIMDHLESEGLAESTILVFTSDHGDMLWSQGKMKKQLPWEESIHIPFIIRHPGHIPSGEVEDSLLGSVDMAPTLLSLAGIEAPEGMQGKDLSGIAKGEAADAPDSVFIMDLVVVDESRKQGLPEWRGVRTSRYTYARLRDHVGWLLYDNEEDPFQLTNLVDDAEYEGVRKQLDAELDRWLRRTEDDFLDGREHLRQLGLTEFWNDREMELHPDDPDLLKEP